MTNHFWQWGQTMSAFQSCAFCYALIGGVFLAAIIEARRTGVRNAAASVKEKRAFLQRR